MRGLLILLILLGGNAMAANSDFRSRLSTVEPDPPRTTDMDRYDQSPEGQAAKRVVDAIRAGDLATAEQEYAAGQERYGWQPKSQAAPISTPEPYKSKRAPLVLPSEAQ